MCTPATHRHEVGRVAADGVKFDPGVPHELGKGVMAGETHAMAESLERRAESDEGLHVAWDTKCQRHGVYGCFGECNWRKSYLGCPQPG